MDIDDFLSDLAYDIKVVQANASQAKIEAFRFDSLYAALDGLDAVMDSLGTIRASILRVREDAEYNAIMQKVTTKC